jgi:chromosome partitioning protein
VKKLFYAHTNDYIIVDGPPSLGLLTINSLVAADEILIPTQSEYYALEGLGQLLSTINLIQENLKPELKIMGTVITMFDKRNKLSEAVMGEIYQYFPNRIFRSIIPRTVRLAEAPSYGRSILQYDPKSKGGRAYESLAKEILSFEKLTLSVNLIFFVVLVSKKINKLIFI